MFAIFLHFRRCLIAGMAADEADDSDMGPVCTNSGYTFSGLDETEEEDTSVVYFRANIPGSILVLAVASALL
jgi:hypothetical protein